MSSTDQQDPQVVQPVQVLYCESMTLFLLYTLRLSAFTRLSLQSAHFPQSIVNLGPV